MRNSDARRYKLTKSRPCAPNVARQKTLDKKIKHFGVFAERIFSRPVIHSGVQHFTIFLLFFSSVAFADDFQLNRSVALDNNQAQVRLNATKNTNGSYSLTTIGTGTDFIILNLAVAQDNNGAKVRLSGTKNNDGTFSLSTTGGGGAGGDALTTNPLSQFASTTSLQLAGVISDETGSGSLVFATSPTFVTPILGTPTSETGTNLSGTGANFTAGHVTTNANLTGPITSTGNATAIASQTGTGSTFVMNTSPTLVTPALGVATATSINGNTFTTGTGTLTLGAGKTTTFNSTSTFTATDAQTYTFPTTSATLARTDAANTFTGHQTIEGVTSTGATGTGKLVFDTAPQLSTIELGAASDTTIARSGAGAITVEGVAVLLSGGNAGTPSALVGTNISGTGASFTSGNATKWTTGRTVSTTGDVTYTSGSLDGSANVTGTATVANVPATATFGSDVTSVPNATGGWKEYFVTTSNFTTTNTTATTITGLTTDTLSASTLYEVEASLIGLNDADTNGIKFAWTGTNSPTGSLVGMGTTTAAAGTVLTYGAAGTLGGARCGTSAGLGIEFLRGFITTGTATATLSMQVAKVTSGTATVKIGSVMRVRKAHP